MSASSGADSSNATCGVWSNQDRNVFASLLVALGHGDAMISGMTRTFAQTIKEVRQVLDPKRRPLAFRHPHDGRQDATPCSLPIRR